VNGAEGSQGQLDETQDLSYLVCGSAEWHDFIDEHGYDPTDLSDFRDDPTSAAVLAYTGIPATVYATPETYSGGEQGAGAGCAPGLAGAGSASEHTADAHAALSAPTRDPHQSACTPLPRRSEEARVRLPLVLIRRRRPTTISTRRPNRPADMPGRPSGQDE